MPAAGSLDISPEDFGRMIVRWSDDEVERLRGVVATEARQRGLLPPEQDPKGDASAGRSIRQRRPLAEGLAPGKVNAIRAASQAGVKLSKIDVARHVAASCSARAAERMRMTEAQDVERRHIRISSQFSIMASSSRFVGAGPKSGEQREPSSRCASRRLEPSQSCP
jgi:hypothetical protein